MTSSDSFCMIMITFEQEGFVRDAVRSMLAQDCPATDILISDDCSRDGTYAAIEAEVATYSGPHRVRTVRQSKNIGPDNLLYCLEQTQGESIVIFHGDDVSAPNRSRRLLETLDETGASLVGSNAIEIDADDNVLRIRNPDAPSGWIDPGTLIETGDPRMLGGALAYKRDLIDRFPKLGVPRSWGVTDKILPLRAAALDGAWYLDEHLMQFRRHSRNHGSGLQDPRKSDLVYKEGQAASFLISRCTMLDDLSHFMRDNSETPELLELRQRVSKTIEAHLIEWTHMRNTLLVQRQRPTWVDRDEIDALRDAARAYKTMNRKRSLPRQAVARLGSALVNLGTTMR